MFEIERFVNKHGVFFIHILEPGIKYYTFIPYRAVKARRDLVRMELPVTKFLLIKNYITIIFMSINNIFNLIKQMTYLISY